MTFRIHARTVTRFLMAAGLLALFIGAGAVNAQVLYGSLTGTVSDPTHAVIPNVAVAVTNQGTGEVRNTKTNEVGRYDILDMLPGTYSLSVPRTGNFAGYTQWNIKVDINRQVRVDITLQPAGVSTQITVNDAPPELQTETANVSHELSEAELGQLPITSSQGRSFQALYTIVPGAAAVQEKNSTASNPSRAMSVNVNGMNYNGNTTRIDGAMNYYGWLPYLIAYVPPAESIESVTIDTNSFNAEQGLAGGAVVTVTTKSGTRSFHGTAWEYYQDAGFNARPYTATKASLTNARNPTGSVPKNVFDQFGFNIGGPVYLPRILTGKKKLFFFDNFERTTRRQLITNTLTLPDAKMLGGDFSEVAGLFTIYDPGATAPYTAAGARTAFLGNVIPSARIDHAHLDPLLNALAPIVKNIAPTAAQLAGQMANDYNGTGTLASNRNTNDAKINYIPTENTQIFGKYSIEPFSVSDAQALGQAGGPTLDGGQPGAAAGRIQNVGLGASHVFNPKIVVDADFGYTRQVTGAQSTVDVQSKDYGSTTLNIPGTNEQGPYQGPNYYGQPYFGIGTISSGGGTTGFTSLGNASGANPFLFRDNQFTGDVNLSWITGKHSTKYGFTYYHFDLNHFQPTSGSYINNPRGGFAFQGGMTSNGTVNAYTALADFLLGLPNQSGGGPAVAKAVQIANPNSIRWTEFGAYAQDQWSMTSKLTVNYGIRYEYYPTPYRDHTGIYILDPNLPLSANVAVGGVNGEPENAGLSAGWGFISPRLGVAYRLNEKTVIRSGFGLTSDPDSFRFLRDAFPMDVVSNFSSLAANTIAVDSTNGNAPMNLAYGIPQPPYPNFSSGFASLPVSGSTTTAVRNFRRGYVESWNLFVQRDLSHSLVANVGYVGTQDVRQFTQTGYLNAAPLPGANTPCMSNGHFNPSLPGAPNGPCASNVNEIVNVQWCGGLSACYNTGGIGVVAPLFSANYNALQSQLTYRGGASKQFGVVYTYSKAIDLEDNGAGSGSGGLSWNYPGTYRNNRALAGFDQKHNLEIWGIYNLPFGQGHALATSGVAAAILGGWQLNGQFSHFSGSPFSVSANSNTLNTPGTPLFGQLTGGYKQTSGHARTAGSPVSGGSVWFNTSSFSNPVEPSFCAQGDAKCTTPNGTAAAPAATPVLANTNRNQFRGPGVSVANASVFRAFPLYRESVKFEVRFEAFNIANHALLYSNPGGTVGSSTFGMITSFGPGYSPTQGARSLQLGGRFSF